MATHTERFTRVTTPDDRTVQQHVVQEEYADQAVPATTAPPAHNGLNLAISIIWYLTGLLMILLAFRFFLALFGANPSNSFANFIYSLSYPFVAPFFDLFSYTRHYGASVFEVYTLVAMAVYAVIAWGIVKLLTIGRRAQHAA